MKEGNLFQTILLIVFGLLIFGGFIAFSLIRGGGESDPEKVVGDVEIWGTFKKTTIETALVSLEEVLPDGYIGSVRYVEFDERTFNEELVDALAAGNGPDVILIKHSDIIKQLNKIYTIPFERYSVRRFKNTYIEGAELFMGNTGVLALPFVVDPLIMYWNRDILNREHIAVVPSYWGEFYELSPKLTKDDSTANIHQATVSLGEYRNIINAKEIVSALLLQAGNPITKFNSHDQLKVVLREEREDGQVEDGKIANSTESALRFYTEFSNPVKSVYSWNRALNDSKRMFVSGDLVFYFGFSSEIQDLSRSNPNLNFDIAALPQIKTSNTPVTYGDMYGLAIMKSSKNISGSVKVIAYLSSNAILSVLSEETLLPPITRSLLDKPPIAGIDSVLYDSALISRAWLEPDSDEVDIIFRDLIEEITSGRLITSQALGEAQAELRNLIK